MQSPKDRHVRLRRTCDDGKARIELANLFLPSTKKPENGKMANFQKLEESVQSPDDRQNVI
jgi:hypothetical protein